MSASDPLFRLHASPEAIRVGIRKAREAVRVARNNLHSLECLLESREFEIADGTWPALSSEDATRPTGDRA